VDRKENAQKVYNEQFARHIDLLDFLRNSLDTLATKNSWWFEKQGPAVNIMVDNVFIE
jgi:hypothetical protein